MSPKRAKFTGSIRLVADVDTIGVPIFTAVKGNETYVPEMDGDLRITAFTEFYNEHEFPIHYDIPGPYRDSTYYVGSSAPMPFWLDHQCHVILGDADKEEPVKLFGPNALKNPVLADIARLLDDARSGRIADNMREWASANIVNSFADVFFETPNRARYWIARYRHAVAHARKKTKPPHPIDVKLRLVASDWLRRFGSKCDLRKLGGMLGNSSDEIFSKRQMTDMIFAFLVDKFARNENKDIDVYLQEPALHKALPEGIYHYFLEAGWPRVPFQYSQIENFNEHMMDCLSNAHEADDYEDAAKMAFFLYGRGRVPEQIEALARTYMNYVKDDFDRIRRSAAEIFRDRESKHCWSAYADELLQSYNNLMDLDGIVNAAERMKRDPWNNRFGVPSSYLKDLKKIQKGQW